LANGNNLANAGADANNAPRGGPQACSEKQVSPVVAVAAPKIVLVKKVYQKDAHRIKVKLSTDCTFTATGKLTSGQAAESVCLTPNGAVKRWRCHSTSPARN